MSESIVCRLTDPHRVLAKEDGSYDHERLTRLQAKINVCMTRMFQKPENGGNPFLYALTIPKPHELAVNLPRHNRPFTTAATNGKKFFWNPDFLDAMSADEVPVVMEHEGYHVILFHHSRGRGLDQRVFNWSVDYVVNAIIETQHKQLNRKGKLWGGERLGEPLSFQTLIDFIDGKTEFEDDKHGIFADVSLHGRSPEGIYDEIMQHWQDSPRRCKTCGSLSLDPKTGKPKPKKSPGKGKDKDKGKDQSQGGGGQKPDDPGQKDKSQGSGPQDQCQDPSQDQGGSCGNCGGHHCCPDCGSEGDSLSPMDAHIPGEMTKDEVMADVMRASQQTAAMRGFVPSEVEEALAELMKPTLKWTDLIRNAFMRKVKDAGMKNDWKRLRRRWITANPKQYLPRRHTYMPRGLVMLDTSGSMGDDDLAYGVSQLQVLGPEAEMLLVPCDATPKWEDVQKITGKPADLKRVRVVGRGGTVFDQFFEEYPKKLGTDFDVIVVITDSECGTVPLHLRPRCDVVWVVTRKGKDYKPSFGRVAPLRPQNS